MEGMVVQPELQLLGQTILGYGLQWARGPKKIPNWVSWAGFGAMAAGVYVWITPGFGGAFHDNWRMALAGFASFVLGMRGAAGTSKDAKVAPQTNSL